MPAEFLRHPVVSLFYPLIILSRLVHRSHMYRSAIYHIFLLYTVARYNVNSMFFYITE